MTRMERFGEWVERTGCTVVLRPTSGQWQAAITRGMGTTTASPAPAIEDAAQNLLDLMRSEGWPP